MLLEYDYYFADDFVQIQGRARLPGIKQKAEADQSSGKSKSPAQFLTLEERRKLCHQEALFNAHSKWLSITDQKWDPQKEWLLRVKKGARGHWGNCLNSARIQNTYYDRPNSCRLVVHYDCDPRSY